MDSVKQFEERFNGLELVIASYEYEDDREHVSRLNLQRVIENLTQTHWEVNLDEIQDVKRIKQELYEVFDFHCGIFTNEEWEERKSEEHRQKCEMLAAKIVAQYNVKPYSIEFLNACNAELERFKTYREGMREDGLCIGYGVTADQWNEEFNESQSDSASVHDVLSWIEKNVPLLYMKWQESLKKQ